MTGAFLCNFARKSSYKKQKDEMTGDFVCYFAEKSSYKKQKDEMTGDFVCYFAEKSSYKKQKDEKTKALAKRCCFVLIFQCLHIYQNFR